MICICYSFSVCFGTVIYIFIKNKLKYINAFQLNLSNMWEHENCLKTSRHWFDPHS